MGCLLILSIFLRSHYKEQKKTEKKKTKRARLITIGALTSVVHNEVNNQKPRVPIKALLLTGMVGSMEWMGMDGMDGSPGFPYYFGRFLNINVQEKRGSSWGKNFVITVSYHHQVSSSQSLQEKTQTKNKTKNKKQKQTKKSSKCREPHTTRIFFFLCYEMN